jgi:hypothetical protein
LLALKRALIMLRKQNRCLSNCRKDLTKVDFSESERWMVIRRGDSSGESALLFCNLSPEARTLPTPREASAFELALFTGEQRFAATPASPSPPAVIDAASKGIEIAQFSAALYLGGARSR